MTSAGTGARVRREAAADLLKGLGIVGVVFIHAARSPWDSGAVPIEIWLARLAHFAVPGFLAVSGFLYATSDRIPAATTTRRLTRILVPYLVASVAAQLWWVYVGETRAPMVILQDLLLANSLGQYYYVFQIFTLVLLAPLIPHLPLRALVPLTALLILAQLFLNSLGLPLFWALRIPIFSGGSFMLGWTIRRHESSVRAFIAAQRGVVLAALVAVIVGCATGMTLGLPEFADRSCEWLYVNTFIFAIFALALGRGDGPSWLAQLSDSTYAIYLFHVLFIYAVARARPLAAGEFDIAGMALLWAAGMAGSALVIAIAKLVLGGRARLLIGA